jgi:hypothetical protein
MGFWKASEMWAGDRGLDRKLTSDEIYNWVNAHKAEINEKTTNPYLHNDYLRGRKTKGHTIEYIKLLTNIVNGRKMVLDKYRTEKKATQPEIEALNQMLQLPYYVRDWLKTQELTESQKQLFNLMPDDSGSGSSADATGAGSGAGEATTTDASADAGGRRRRKTSFRRRRMSRYRSSKSKSKSKKSRKSRKCVR